MNSNRFLEVTSKYPDLHLGIVGDFCLDRYLEIDPARSETSIETGLPVHNVVRVRSQPGAAGTILNNLVALGIGRMTPIAFCGDDGEGYELQRALRGQAGVDLKNFFASFERRTFTYCKPLIIKGDCAPQELNRLDSKNWNPTPSGLQIQLAEAAREVALSAHGLVVMDQVDLPETGVVGQRVLEELAHLAELRPGLVFLADSRRGLKGYPDVGFKMNESELNVFTGQEVRNLDGIKALVTEMVRTKKQPVFVTLAERGMVGASPGASAEHVPAFPVTGDIDIVGAGDAVTANLTAALAAGATTREAMELAMAAASIVIHQLGTTGTATREQLRERLFGPGPTV